MFLTGGTKLVLYLPIPDGREDTSIDEPESIPLSRTLSLKVPPNPALGRRFISADLGLDVAPRVILVRCRPLRNVVSPAALAQLGVAQIGTIEAGAAAVAVQVPCAVPCR
jgi:hypothetical protein